MERSGLKTRALQSVQMSMILFIITWMMLMAFWQPCQCKGQLCCSLHADHEDLMVRTLSHQCQLWK